MNNRTADPNVPRCIHGLTPVERCAECEEDARVRGASGFTPRTLETNFEPCYCAKCDGKLPAPCRYGTGTRTSKPSYGIGCGECGKVYVDGKPACECKLGGPPFTVERYGSFGGAVCAENLWLKSENERLRNDMDRAWMRMQCADVPRTGPWHWEVCTMLDGSNSAAVETAERPMPQAGDACDLCMRTWVQLPNAGLWHECMPKRPAQKTTERSPKDFAIEFAGYMATAAEELMAASNSLSVEGSSLDAIDRHSHAFRTLESRIYEFRKRAERAELNGSPATNNEK